MSAEVMFNRETHKSRGFGFIVFELERGAEQVCAEREHTIDGKVVSTRVLISLSLPPLCIDVLPPPLLSTLSLKSFITPPYF